MTYESDILRDWYLLFHYGTRDEIIEGAGLDLSGIPSGCFEFPVATVAAAGIEGEISRSLDIGCAVGRSTLELSRYASEVIGVDFSASFINTADRIRRGEAISYRRYAEMHLATELVANLPDGVHPDRVSYEQGDAMALRDDLGDFDLVHAANLICRLPEPIRFLARLPQLVRPGGRLVLATPATWLVDHTPAANQPGGLTLDYLRVHLGEGFDLVSVAEVPFLIREHQRKFQISTSQTSLWVRR